MPTSRDMAIFVLTTTTQLITLPLAHARGVMYTGIPVTIIILLYYCSRRLAEDEWSMQRIVLAGRGSPTNIIMLISNATQGTLLLVTINAGTTKVMIRSPCQY